jgi:hypothetical protein
MLTNEQILGEIGLTESEVRDYLRKVTLFYETLTRAERKVFHASMRTLEEATLESFRGELTSERLEKFIKSRSPKGAPFVSVIHRTIP